MSADWKQRPEGGGRFAIWMIRGVTQHLGRSIARLLLLPITLYFLIVRGPERVASRAYLARALGQPASLWDVARHIHCFAATLVDRVLLLRGRVQQFDVRIHGVEAVHDYLDAGRGVLLFGSHLGSFEVLRVLAQRRPEYAIRVVLDKSHNPAMTQLMDALNPTIAAGVIDAAQDGPSLVLAIQQAVEDGALVALLVDRTQAGDPSQPAPFLGDIARFPTAPWLIATVLQAPVLLAFGLYRGSNRYDLVFEPFSEGQAIPRPQRAQAIASLICRYVARLEHHARQAPYNWFNFYDFWTDHDDAKPIAPDVAPEAARQATHAIGDTDAGAAVVQPGAGRRRA